MTNHQLHEDPRVTRTRAKVLDVVRTILDHDGPMGVTYSAVAKSAGVGRQTLYNHWSTPAEMIRDAGVEGESAPPSAASPSADEAVRTWLRRLRDELAEGPQQSLLSSLVAIGPHSPDGESAVRTVARERVAAFNDVLAPLGRWCSLETYALMVGPVTYQTLIAREPVTDALIERIVADVTPELCRHRAR